jgi:hypothetical protein
LSAPAVSGAAASLSAASSERCRPALFDSGKSRVQRLASFVADCETGNSSSRLLRHPSTPLHHHPPDANQRFAKDSALQPIVTLFVARSPWGATGTPLRQQSTYSKRTRSSPTTTAKGCGLRHFCMFCRLKRNDGVFDADSPGPARQWSMSPWARSSARTRRGSRTDFRRISLPYRHGSQHGERRAGALVDDARSR